MKRGSHQIIVGDCLTELAKIPAGTFHACMTSPHYVGIELNENYAAHANQWINREPRWSLRQKTKAAKKTVKPSTGQGLLF